VNLSGSGRIIEGLSTNSFTTVFTVDASGNVNASGQLISTVTAPAGSPVPPPIVVSSTTPVANLTTAPVTYDVNGNQQVNVHVVTGTLTIGTSSTAVNLSGAAAFALNSYSCTATSIGTTGVPLAIIYDSGSMFELSQTTGASGPLTASFICIGK
jgi:hypothetical protein